MIQPNYSYRAITNDIAEESSRTILCTINHLGFSIAAETKGSVLVDITSF
jgi:hypothetical protein